MAVDGNAKDDANTPLDEDERDALIPQQIVTHTQLNQWEAANIPEAHVWLDRRRPTEILDVGFHRLVFIHPWPNGNGRHARLATDLLLMQWKRPPFSWGSGASLVAANQSRSKYIRALRAADRGDFGPLVRFCRS